MIFIQRNIISINWYFCFYHDLWSFLNRHDQTRCQRYRKQPRVKTTTQRYEDDDEDTEDDIGDFPEPNYPFDTNPSGRDLIDVASNAVSQCPVENGVIRTTWGTVAAGPLIAGTNVFFS